MTEIRIVVLADLNGRRFDDDVDPADVTFDEHGTPILEYGYHPVHRDGWTLWTADGEEHFISSRLDDVEWATGQARQRLEMGGGIMTGGPQASDRHQSCAGEAITTLSPAQMSCPRGDLNPHALLGH